MITFTKEELNEIKILVRLGDSESLAKQTVIGSRKVNNQEHYDAYKQAYCG